MHINTVIMKAVSCPPWFQTVQRNNLEAQCNKMKVNTQRISACEELFLWWPTQIGANVLQWMNVKGSNKKEQNMHILFEVVPIIAQWWRLRNFDFSAKIFSIYLTFVSRCINTHTHTPWGDCCELVQYKQNRTELNKMIMWYIKEKENNTWDKILSACCLPETACSIAQHLGCMDVELAVIMVIWGGVPVRVGYDDTIGQNGQGILDDWHLQCITWWQVPKHTCIWMCSENKKHYPIYV